MPVARVPKVPITTVQDWLDHVDSLRRGVHDQAHLRLWFRGHADFAWPLRPAVYRKGFAHDEQERLRKERHLTQDFRVGSAGLRDPHMTDVDLYFLQQQYGMPTRLLDWTSDALAALYFAVTDEAHHKIDGGVIMMDAYRFHPSLSGIASSRRPKVRSSVALIAAWPASKDSSDFPERTFALRPDQFDVRMSLQRAGFTFHVPREPELTPAMNGTLRTVMVAAPAKKSLKEQLAALGADAFGVFGDLESLSQHLKWAYRVLPSLP